MYMIRKRIPHVKIIYLCAILVSGSLSYLCAILVSGSLSFFEDVEFITIISLSNNVLTTRNTLRLEAITDLGTRVAGNFGEGFSF